MNKALLMDMLKTVSVSGYEIELQKKVKAHMETFCDEVRTDLTGNVVSILNPTSPFKVLLCGHIDEIGFIVSSITSDGMLKITKCGGIQTQLYPGSHVQIKTKEGILYGAIITNQAISKNTALSPSDLYVDIGATSWEEAKKHVSIGDCLCAASDVRELLNERFSGRALDDRIGAFIVMEATKRAKARGCDIGVYCATTVGEETSMRGAFHASAAIQPSCAIIVDVTYTSDYPGVDGATTGEVSLDKGPVLCKSSIVNDALNALLEETATKLNISIQWEIAAGKAGTDGDIVHFTNEGVPIALISIPLRYMHSSIETGSYKDMEEIIALLTEFLCSVQESFSFDPFQ